MACIELVNGDVTEVDWEDLAELSKYRWRMNAHGYAFRYATKKEKLAGHPQVIYLHRWLLNAPKSHIVDHRDRNPLNNRKSNLRLCDRSQNAANGLAHQDARSQYRGVCWSPTKKLWRATIQRGGKWMYLGYFDSEEDAARAYDAAAVKLFGEFANTNFQGTTHVAPPKRVIRANNTSGYRGVTYSKSRRLWQAQIETRLNGKRKAINLGFFATPEEAALAYNEAAERIQGNKARLNEVKVIQ